MHGNFLYTPELAQKVIDVLSSDTRYDDVKEQLGLPALRTVYDWVDNFPDFAANITRARAVQGHNIVEKLKEIEKKLEQQRLPSDVARVLINSKQWRASKANPKAYGDKMTVAGDSENPVMLLATRLDEAIARKRQDKLLDVTPKERDFSDLC